MQVLAAGERFAGDFGDAGGDRRALLVPASLKRRSPVVKNWRASWISVAGWFQFRTLASRDSTRRKWSATTLQQSRAGRFERRRVVGCGDALRERRTDRVRVRACGRERSSVQR